MDISAKAALDIFSSVSILPTLRPGDLILLVTANDIQILELMDSM